MATVDLDVGRLSAYCQLPQASITNLLDAPTKDLVQSLLESITIRAREQEEWESEKLRINIELENAVRGAESKSRVLKSSVDKAQREVSELREKLHTAGA